LSLDYFSDTYRYLESLAASIPNEINDSFGGLFVPIRLDRTTQQG